MTKYRTLTVTWMMTRSAPIKSPYKHTSYPPYFGQPRWIPAFRLSKYVKRCWRDSWVASQHNTKLTIAVIIQYFILFSPCRCTWKLANISRHSWTRTIDLELSAKAKTLRAISLGHTHLCVGNLIVRPHGQTAVGVRCRRSVVNLKSKGKREESKWIMYTTELSHENPVIHATLAFARFHPSCTGKDPSWPNALAVEVKYSPPISIKSLSSQTQKEGKGPLSNDPSIRGTWNRCCLHISQSCTEYQTHRSAHNDPSFQRLLRNVFLVPKKSLKNCATKVPKENSIV